MLSRNEEQQLRAIEQWFEMSDPALTRSMREGRVQQGELGRRVCCIALVVLGVALIGLGAVTTTVPLLFAGILGLTSGVCLHMSAVRL